MRGKSLMIQGTASSVGKSVLCAALLRIMKQDGLRAAHIRARKGMDAGAQVPVSMAQLREREFDRIASIVRASVDMDAIYRILRGEA